MCVCACVCACMCVCMCLGVWVCVGVVRVRMYARVCVSVLFCAAGEVGGGERNYSSVQQNEPSILQNLEGSDRTTRPKDAAPRARHIKGIIKGIINYYFGYICCIKELLMGLIME